VISLQIYAKGKCGCLFDKFCGTVQDASRLHTIT
jgi:hypothetical protein